MTDRETYSEEGPQCPHCNRQFTADEAVFFDAANYTSQGCDECGKTFKVSVYTSTSWTCEPLETEAAAP